MAASYGLPGSGPGRRATSSWIELYAFHAATSRSSTGGIAAAYEASSNPAFTDGDFATLFGGDNHRSAASAPGLIANLTPGSFDWTPTGDAATGCNTVAIPGTYNTANFFGGTLTLPAYCGAVDPAGPKWYEGWTSYATN